jgi:hypothetical protein
MTAIDPNKEHMLKLKAPGTPSRAWLNVFWTRMRSGDNRLKVTHKDSWLGCPEQVGPDDVDIKKPVQIWVFKEANVEANMDAVAKLMAQMAHYPPTAFHQWLQTD